MKDSLEYHLEYQGFGLAVQRKGGGGQLVPSPKAVFLATFQPACEIHAILRLRRYQKLQDLSSFQLVFFC